MDHRQGSIWEGKEVSEGDTYPLDGSAEMWRNRALQAEADLRDECNRHGEILFIVEAENARLRKALEQIESDRGPVGIPIHARHIARAALASAHPGDREPSNPTPERT